MMPIGDGIGQQIANGGRIWAMAPLCFLIGAFVTIAEPDLQVLAKQVPAVPDMVIILTVAAGVGFFMVVALLRAKFGWELNRLLIGFYILVFIMAFLVPEEFLAVAFDSGGVTTGPITVPFIMAMGAGLTALRRGSGSEADSFGVVALSSIGPILAVMILGLCYNSSDLSYTLLPSRTWRPRRTWDSTLPPTSRSTSKRWPWGWPPLLSSSRSFRLLPCACAGGSWSRSSWVWSTPMWAWCSSSPA